MCDHDGCARPRNSSDDRRNLQAVTRIKCVNENDEPIMNALRMQTYSRISRFFYFRQQVFTPCSQEQGLTQFLNGDVLYL